MGALTLRLLFACISSGLAGFQHGYNIGFVNAPLEIVRKWVGEQVKASDKNEDIETEKSKITILLSIMASIFCIGGIVGAVGGQLFVSKIGRKWILILNSSTSFIGAALFVFCKKQSSVFMLIAGRFVVGINAGINASIAPLYIYEISPISIRGATGSSYQLNIVISILVSQVLGMGSIMGTTDRWHYLFAFIAIPAVLMDLMMLFCPESPVYYVNKGNVDAATKSLKWLRGTDDVGAEISAIQAETKGSEGSSVPFSEIMKTKIYRWPLFLSCFLMFAQQLSGINAVIFFSTKIFDSVHLSLSQAQFCTTLIGIMNLVMTIISMAVVELAGRKTLLLLGFGGMFVDTALLVVAMTVGGEILSYMAVGLVILFVVCFAIGPGTIPWFLVSELTDKNIRPLAISSAVATNWLFNFVVGVGFLPLEEILGGKVFVIFAVLQLLFTIFILIFIPETKNKTIEEVQKLF